jgi:hypothetical protein
MLSDDNELFTDFDSIMRDVYLYHRHAEKEDEELTSSNEHIKNTSRWNNFQ